MTAEEEIPALSEWSGESYMLRINHRKAAVKQTSDVFCPYLSARFQFLGSYYFKRVVDMQGRQKHLLPTSCTGISWRY